MNMFKPTKATTVEEYIANVPPERKEAFTTLHELILKTVPELPPFFANNMIGYGSFDYVNYKKETVTWPTIALANNKNYISIYLCSVENGEYIAEKLSTELGNVSVGKSCIRLKKLEDLNQDALKKALKMAAKKPGLR